MVVDPDGPDGPRALLQGGARQVLVLGDTLESEPGIDVRPYTRGLPLRDNSVDLVCSVERFGALRREDRAYLMSEAARVLRSTGAFAGWIEHAEARVFGRVLDGSAQIDFWRLEDELTQRFSSAVMLAQMPWRGFSVAPVLDEREAEEPVLHLEEQLLHEIPEASHYLALAGEPGVVAALSNECLLVPVPGDGLGGSDIELAAIEERADRLEDEVERLREEIGLRAAKAAAAQGRVRELEAQLANVRAESEGYDRNELEGLRDALNEAQAQLEAARARESQSQEEMERLTAVQQEQQEARHDEDVTRLEGELVAARRRRAELEEELGEAQGQLEEVATELRSKTTDLGILIQTSRDQEAALNRVAEELEGAKSELGASRGESTQLRRRLEELAQERVEMRRQVDVLLAEREGARTLAKRVEAELEVAKRRAAEQEAALSEKIEEASRLAGEGEAMRQRLNEQEGLLAETRTRAEQLSAQAEQGRMLTDVVHDRDRLREELANRQTQIQKLEERLWKTREELQAERIETVRGGSELERLKEQVERARAIERERGEQIERLGRSLREMEVERASLAATLKARDERIESLKLETESMAGQSADLQALRDEMERRAESLSEAREQLSRANAERDQQRELARRREAELAEAGDALVQARRGVDDQARLATRLQGDLDVKQVELEQLAAQLANTQQHVVEQKASLASANATANEAQRKLEDGGAELRRVRQRLRQAEQELDDLTSARENSDLELFKLRRELEASALASEDFGDLSSDATKVDPSWPAAARAEIVRLGDSLNRERKLHQSEIASFRELEENIQAGSGQARFRRLQLEAAIRATEQEHMLGQLDSAEQRIWEMTDAADRNAARFEASLAQLEKQKEKVDQLMDELEVTRSLLTAEQARALEQERLLASERAKLARAGFSSSGFRREDSGEVEDIFAELTQGEGGARLLDLSANSKARGVPEPGAPPAPVKDVGSIPPTQIEPAPARARMVVEMAEDDEEWPDEGGGDDGDPSLDAAAPTD